MILRNLRQLVVGEQVRPAVPDVHHTEVRIDLVRHGHRGAHAPQFGMVRRFLDDARVGLLERRLELPEDALRVRPVRVQEPLEVVQRELFNRHDGQGAGLFAGAVSSHAVRHEKQMAAFLAELRFRL